MGSDEQLRFRGGRHALSAFTISDAGPHPIGQGGKAQGFGHFLQKTVVKEGVNIGLAAAKGGAIRPCGRQDHAIRPGEWRHKDAGIAGADDRDGRPVRAGPIDDLSQNTGGEKLFSKDNAFGDTVGGDVDEATAGHLGCQLAEGLIELARFGRQGPGLGVSLWTDRELTNIVC